MESPFSRQMTRTQQANASFVFPLGMAFPFQSRSYGLGFRRKNIFPLWTRKSIQPGELEITNKYAFDSNIRFYFFLFSALSSLLSYRVQAKSVGNHPLRHGIGLLLTP
jgi:hypothetical protein